MLPKMRAKRKNFHETKYITFFIKKGDKFLEKCNEILDKSSNIMRKRFDNEPVSNKKYLNAKISFIKKILLQDCMVISYQKKIISAFFHH